ncbi:MAG: M20/M25/M40 family metallo-hydrolase [Rubrivivax sp.]|nr:M20/M25/M40 family metallo-hydrolase [Rubrivivax sp.]
MTPSLFKQVTVAALATLCTAGAALAAPVWITIGDQAHAVLQKVAPNARTVASARVAVDVPVKRGSSTLKQAHEDVFAVEVDEDMIPSLSLAVHLQLRKCGGFVQHDSMAEALATLHRLENPDQTQLLLPSYAIDNVAEVNALLPQLQASNLLSTITDLSAFQNRRYNSTHGVAASDWLRIKWLTLLPSRTQTGSRPRWRLKQITHTWAQKSVEFELIGSGNSGETLVLGAHLDSIAGSNIEARAPGADDDASGVAGLTEIIRVLVASDFQPKRNIRFIAYAAEEVGLLGSANIANAAAARPDRVVGVMQLDMTAFKGSAQDLWIYTDYTNAAQNQFVANLAATYLPTLTVAYDACGYGCSDHASWHNRGYVASFPFEAANSSYNFAIHTANDTTATFGNQANHALKFTQLALAWLVELASDSTPAVAAAPMPVAASR